jgi:4-hydroxy-3-polyprenylbenzoate decarboxylase
MLVVVDPATSPRDFPAVLRAIRRNFDPARDFLLLPGTSMDTLDFASFKMNLGSKMVIDATGDLGPAPRRPRPNSSAPEIIHPAILRSRVLEDGLLAVQIRDAAGRPGRDVLEDLIQRPGLDHYPLIAGVSEDVDIEDDVQLLWGLLTRFEPARDVFFKQAKLQGIRPVYEGPLAIDATFKAGYPEPLVMVPEIQERVDRRWGEYLGQ